MDTKLLIEDAKARFKHHENKLYLQEKYKNRLSFVSQGGMWTATTDFLCFLSVAPSDIVIKDNYNNPIRVNVPSLKEQAWDIYNQVMDEWNSEYVSLQKNR